MSENDILSKLKYDNSVKTKLGWERWLMFERSTIDRAAAEITRLRARVAELEEALADERETRARLADANHRLQNRLVVLERVHEAARRFADPFWGLDKALFEAARQAAREAQL